MTGRAAARSTGSSSAARHAGTGRAAGSTRPPRQGSRRGKADRLSQTLALGMPAPDNGVRLADLDQALAPLPGPHRALTRLLVCTVIARRHLRQARPSGWLAGIAAGPTGTGKTLIGSVVCQVTGTDPAAAVRPRVTSPTWPCQRPRRATALSPSPQRPSTCSRRTWPSSRPPRQRSRTGQALDLERCVGARRA